SWARWGSAAWHTLGWAIFGAAYAGAVVFVASGVNAAPGDVLLVLAAGSRLSTYIGATVGEIGFLRGIWMDGSRRLAWLEDYAASIVASEDADVPTRLHEGITLDRVSFAYPGTDRLVLDDVSVTLPARAGATAGARAGADDVGARLAAGLDTQLGPTWPGGVEVSFGQWQKVALARGFMRDGPLLLVLDEPTAALDAETEHALFERYSSTARGGNGSPDVAPKSRITILVSHRFSTVRMADLIVVLDGSRVAQVGTHEDLMGKGGPYAASYG